jgi:predicted RNA binding protein YcfA (HicA-like mRNA interferase family)
MAETKRKCKLVKAILANRKHVSFKDMDKLLKAFGYEPKQPRGGSSYYVYRKKGAKPIVVPFKRPFLKEFYVKQVIKLLRLEEFYEENCRQT